MSDNTYIKDLGKKKLARDAIKKGQMAFEFHFHVDLFDEDEQTIKELEAVGMKRYTVEQVCSAIASGSVRFDENSTPRPSAVYQSTYKPESYKELKELAEKVSKIMKKSTVKGYAEGELVYEIVIPPTPFNQEKFDEYFPKREGSSETPDFHLNIMAKEGRFLPFRGILRSLNPEKAGPRKEDFAVGEIHVSVPEYIGEKRVAHPELIGAFHVMGMVGYSVPKLIRSEDGSIMKDEKGEPIIIRETPLTLSSLRMRELQIFTNQVHNILKEVGWTVGETDLPVEINWEHIVHKELFNGFDPAKDYRKVLENVAARPGVSLVPSRPHMIGDIKIPNPAERTGR